MIFRFPFFAMTAFLFALPPVWAQDKDAAPTSIEKPATKENVAKKEAPVKKTVKTEASTKDVTKKTSAGKEAAATPLAVDKKQSNPISTWIHAENAMIDPLSNLDRESIYILRQKHSIIRVIGVVEGDIGNAVKSCGTANPGMKSKIEDRFKQWKNAVNPVIKTARKNLDAEIEKQTIVDTAQLKKVMKLNDAAFEYGDKRIVKDPVSSQSACEALMMSMNDTEDEMIGLLQDTLLPPSVIKSRVDQQIKVEKEKKKSFSKSAKDAQ